MRGKGTTDFSPSINQQKYIEWSYLILSPPLSNRLFLAFAMILFVAAALLRLTPVLINQVLTYDESVSYLVATGHSAEYLYQNGDLPFPAARWASAKDWQRYLQVEPGSSIRSVGTDLLRTDIHPPVYFLLLRVWTKLFGNAYTTGKLLSLLLDLVVLVLLVITARVLLAKRYSGWLTGLIWIASPVAILGGATIRQYSLLTIWTVLFTLLLGQYLLHNDQPTNRTRLVLGLLATAVVGLLTHLVFALVLCAAFVVIMLGHHRSNSWFILPPLLVITIAALLIALFLPESIFFQVYLLPKIRSLGFQDEFLVRFLRRSFMLLLPLSIPFVVYLVTYGTMRLHNKPITIDASSSSLSTLHFLVTMLVVTYGLHSVLFLTGVFYGYTVSDHHLLYLTPLVALVACSLLQLIPRTNLGSLATGGLLVCLFLIPAVRIGMNVDDVRGTIDLHQLANYDVVVVDYVRRPELFTYMNPDSIVFAAHQPELIDQHQDWLPGLLSDGGIYVSLLETGNDAIGNAQGRDQILEMILEEGSVELIGSMSQQGTMVSVYEVDG